MADDSSDKQHQATSKKVEHLKSQGQVLRSKDFSGGLIFIMCEITFVLIGYSVYRSIRDVFVNSFSAIGNLVLLDNNISMLIKKMFFSVVVATSPFFIIAVLVALLSPFLFGGWNFSLKSIEFKWDKINPFINLNRIFSAQILTSIAKSVVKFSIIFGLFIVFLFFNHEELLSFLNIPISSLFVEVCLILKSYLMTISIGIILIVVLDIAYSYFEYNKNAMMTSHELKQEFKETEGNVDVKRKLRMFQMNLIKNRLSVSVPKATVIITNPTHYAIAIRYDENKDKAPKVIAKGKDEIAKHIRELAGKHAIPIYHAPSLARSIYHTTKIGQQINPGLYMAVAIVFSYIYQLKQYQMGRAPSPAYISDLKIPDELKYDE